MSGYSRQHAQKNVGFFSFFFRGNRCTTYFENQEELIYCKQEVIGARLRNQMLILPFPPPLSLLLLRPIVAD